MHVKLFEALAAKGLLSPASLAKVKAIAANRLFSVHWELKTVLYLGVLLLSGGLGILIYKNIDTIGHQAVLAIIAALCGGCFYYSVRDKAPFSREKVPAANGFADYTVLLGCLLFLSFITYLQAQYNVFGTRYGSATFIPMLVLFACAYYFDHLGVLSLAITNFAAWAGVAITPYELFTRNDFTSHRLIYTGMAVGVVLLFAGIASQAKNFKRHFAFTYYNFGSHVLLIACLCALFFMGAPLLRLLWLLACCGGIYYLALRERSFYFTLIVVLYAYTGICYAVTQWLWRASGDMEIIIFTLSYYIVSGVAVARLLVSLNKKLKADDRL